MTIYSLAALVVCLLTWFDVWQHADIIRTGNRPELILSTVAASIGIFTSVIGWAGILLNNRGFLAWYTFLSWITFAFLVTPGYITYKKRTFNLEGKVNAQWSQKLGAEGRMRIQNQLKCCGYFSPFIEATISQTCYARSILPGCKLPYMQFERFVLKRWYAAVFILVPVHIAVMVAALLCSNHITYRFGKGMMPEAYRLNLSTMAVIMENYARCAIFISISTSKPSDDRPCPSSLFPVNSRNNTDRRSLIKSSSDLDRTFSSVPRLHRPPNIRPSHLSTPNTNRSPTVVDSARYPHPPAHHFLLYHYDLLPVIFLSKFIAVPYHRYYPLLTLAHPTLGSVHPTTALMTSPNAHIALDIPCRCSTGLRFPYRIPYILIPLYLLCFLVTKLTFLS